MNHVIAEGIESARQWSQLQALACTHGQGFYISHPLTGAAATEFIERTAWSSNPRLGDAGSSRLELVQ